MCSKSVFRFLFRRTFAMTSVIGDKVPRKPKKSFIKTLLAGSYDEGFLVYPELTSEKLKVVENKFLALQSNSSDIGESISQMPSPSYADNSEEMDHEESYSELTRLSEGIPSLPSSVLIEIHKICVNQILSKYCSEQQKQRYFPLLKGEKSVAFALSEETSGSDPSSINTSAVRNRKNASWTINGCKTWITNAQYANFFLVFSKIKQHEKSSETNELAVFIVDKKTAGVSIESISSCSLEECGIGKLFLKNVELSDNEIVGTVNSGYDIAVELLSSYKYSYAACFSKQLKNLLNETLKFLGPRKQTLIDLKDCELIKKKISDVFLTIYVLDSMLYLTAGFMDNYDIDTSLESAIIHLFCIHHGIAAVENCMELLGSRAFDKSLPYYKISNDLKESASVMFSKNICKMYISLTGLQHAAATISEDLTKLRNSFNFPSFFVKKVVSNWRHHRDSPRLNLNLYTNLHPSLQLSCNQLEYCVLRLQYCVENMLVCHGQEIKDRQIVLEKISEILVDVYGMTAVLGRASRSYCTGIKFSDDEIMLTKTFCQDALVRIKLAINSLLDSNYSTQDLSHFKIADLVIQKGEYYIEHPLTQNIG